MVIRLTKNHKKQSGKILAKGMLITVADGHPYKDFEIVIKDGTMDTPKNELAVSKLMDDKAKKETLTKQIIK